MGLVPKILVYFSIFVPCVFIVAGLTIALVSLRALTTSVKTLECFCPSCPETAFNQKGAATLGLIKVDIQGAVVKPGIYQLEIGQRMADLVDLAGGFAKDADQAYVAKTFNLATELKDQDKVYLPFLEENKVASSDAVSAPDSADFDTNSSNLDINTATLVSINQASSGQLQTLTGIGEARAKAIIANRPYVSLEELVSKDVLSESLFSDLKTQLTL